MKGDRIEAIIIRRLTIMTDEETHVLLKSLAVRIEATLEESRKLLPEEVKEPVTKYAHSFPDCTSFICTPASHPSHYIPYVVRTLPAFVPMYELLEFLETQAAALRQNSNS
jgi:hypothetical protein